MFGQLVDGATASIGSLLLGDVDIRGVRNRIFTTPIQVGAERRCLIVPNVGTAFTPSLKWIEKPMWDVTEHAEILVEESRNFRISSNTPEHGEVAWLDNAWLVAALVEESRPDEPGWFNITIGEYVRPVGELLRFSGWRLCDRAGGRELFRASPPPAEPRIRVLG